VGVCDQCSGSMLLVIMVLLTQAILEIDIQPSSYREYAATDIDETLHSSSI